VRKPPPGLRRQGGEVILGVAGIHSSCGLRRLTLTRPCWWSRPFHFSPVANGCRMASREHGRESMTCGTGMRLSAEACWYVCVPCPVRVVARCVSILCQVPLSCCWLCRLSASERFGAGQAPRSLGLGNRLCPVVDGESAGRHRSIGAAESREPEIVLWPGCDCGHRACRRYCGCGPSPCSARGTGGKRSPDWSAPRR
jgi:hypothetical protein